MLDTALTYHNAGLKVIPFWNREGGRKSFPDQYAQFRETQTEEDVRRLFGQDVDGIALLCTDGIEVIDIDVKHDPQKEIGKEYFAALKEYNSTEKALEECVIQKTKSGGWHIIYRTDKLMGNSKLAYRPGEKEAMLETRGKGGIVFVYPTPGYSIKRGDLCAIPEMNDKTRDRFIQVAKEFNTPKEVYIPPAAQKDYDGEKPGDAFNANTDIVTMMEGYGWKVVGRRGERVHLNRPGAKNSRATDATCHLPTNTFYPFSTSTDFDAEESYSPFAVYAFMEHGRNFSEAAKDLSRQGFGDRKELTIEAAMEQEQPANPEKKNDLLQKARASKYDYDEPIKEDEIIFTNYKGRKAYRVSGFGQMGVFTGHEKSGKSFVASCVAASALRSGTSYLNFSLDLKGRKMLWFDTEQSRFFYQHTQKRIHDYGAVSSNVPFYEAYHLRQFSPAERLLIIEEIIYSAGNIGCIMIDGFVDLMRDYNSLEESQEMVGKLLKWSDELNCLLLGVLHVNKGDGKIRGHLGSEIKNKADFVINVRQPEPNLYEVSNPTSRYMGFPTFHFSRDEETGAPHVDEAMTDANF